jgi:RES domain-containing protein
LSLATLEYLVHVDFDNLPSNLVWLKIEVPDAATNEVFPHPVAPNERDAATYGDDWLKSKRSLSLTVPSVVLSVERNVILNPAHTEMRNVRTVEINSFEFDDRLFRR